MMEDIAIEALEHSLVKLQIELYFFLISPTDLEPVTHSNFHKRVSNNN